MLLFLLLLALGTSRYQYLSKGDAIDVVTLPKEDALKAMIDPNSPSYTIVKQRHKWLFLLFIILRYNCFSTSDYGNSAKKKPDLLKASKLLLKKEVFNANTELGTVTITPTISVQIQKEEMVCLCGLLSELAFILSSRPKHTFRRTDRRSIDIWCWVFRILFYD